MDMKQIQELVKLINKSNIGELSIEENDFKITIKQKKEAVQNITLPPAAPASPSPMLPVTKLDLPKATETEISKEDNLVTIKSPMIGCRPLPCLALTPKLLEALTIMLKLQAVM